MEYTICTIRIAKKRVSQTPTFQYINKEGQCVSAIWNIGDREFVDCNSLTLDEINKICNSKNPELVTRGYAEGIYIYCHDNGLNPKVLLATLGQEQGWCKGGNYDKAFGVGPGGNPESIASIGGSIKKAGDIYLQWYNDGLTKNNLTVKNINRDAGPSYNETVAACKGKWQEWQDKHRNYVQYMENGQDIVCVNAAMYAKIKYTPWVDFPPQNSHPLEDWLNIYNTLEDAIR